jgi:hypothetical protein
MATASDTLTIGDWAAQSDATAAEKKVYDSFLSTPNLIEDIPLSIKPNIRMRSPRMTEAGIPYAKWARINDDAQAVKTTTDSVEAEMAFIREKIRIDGDLLNDPTWTDDPFDVQFRGAMRGNIHDLNWALINNDPSLHGTGQHDEDAPTGFKVRLRNAALYKINSSLRIDAGGLNMKKTMTSANAQDFFEFLEQAFAYLGADGGEGCVAYCNWVLKARFSRAIKLQEMGAGLSSNKDQYDRQVDMYRRLRVKDLGFYRGDVSAPYFPLTEDSTGVNTGSDDRTSLLIVRYGDEYVKGWQNRRMAPEFLGKSKEDGIFYNAVLNWGFGLHHINDRSFCEIYNMEIS